MTAWDSIRPQWHIAVLTVLAYIFWSRTPSNNPVPTMTDIIISNLTEKLHVVEEVCSETTNACYLIADLGLMENGRLRVIRQMIMKNLMQFRFTAVELIVPEELSYENCDTSKWAIDRITLHSTIYELMVNLTTVEIDPDMVSFARKWFGFAESETNNLYIVDGVRFMELAAKIVESTNNADFKYKAILLDACESQRAPVLCPVESFLEEDVIKNFAVVLEDDGVLAANLLALENVIDNEERALNLYKAHFKTCFLLRYSPAQRLLLCSHKENWDFKNHPNFIRNAAIADKKFRFELTSLLQNFPENFK